MIHFFTLHFVVDMHSCINLFFDAMLAPIILHFTANFLRT